MERCKGMDIWIFLRLFGKLSDASQKGCPSPSPPLTPQVVYESILFTEFGIHFKDFGQAVWAPNAASCKKAEAEVKMQ